MQDIPAVKSNDIIARTHSVHTPDQPTVANGKSSYPTCILLGEGALLAQCARLLVENEFCILQIITEDKQVHNFAKDLNIPVLATIHNLAEYMENNSVDYLFSIINHHIIPERILSQVKKLSINYHDGPLPSYAGLNATYWALVNGEKKHGITWHVIEPGIDTGDILKQHIVEINPDDTSFTLNIKCFEGAFQAFSELVSDIVYNQLTFIKQDPQQRSYYGTSQRPLHSGVISWQQTAVQIETLCQASDFGFYTNPLGLPKILIGNTMVLVRRGHSEETKSINTPGTIIAISDDSLTFATTTNNITLSQFSTIDGLPLTISQLKEQYNLKENNLLSEASPKNIQRIQEIDSRIARYQNYWVKKLSVLQPTILPFVSRLPLSPQSDTPYPITVPLSDFTKEFLYTYKENSKSINFLISTYLVYLARVTGTTHLQIGFVTSHLQEKLHELPDFFATNVPLQVDIDLQKDFEAVYTVIEKELKQVQKAETYNRDITARYPVLRNKNEVKENPLFPIVLVKSQKHPTHYTQLGRDLTIWIVEEDNSIHLLGNPFRLDTPTMEQMSNQLATFLQELIRNLHEPVHKHALLSVPERHRILVEWNNTAKGYQTDICMHQLVEKQAALTPNAIAVLFEDTHLTYAQLNEKANQLAHLLLLHGAAPEVLVGICMEKSLEMVIGVLGIQKAGAAYVPLEPSAPKDRLGIVLNDLQLTLLITQEALKSKFDSYEFTTIAIDGEGAKLKQQRTSNPTSFVTPDNLAYIIYTSGSTGIPKGVMVRHRPAINLIEWVNNTFQMGATDRVLFVNSLGFDLSVYDIFGMLAAGGSVRIASKTELQNPQQLLEILYQEPITLWNSAPATLSQLLPFSNIVQQPATTSLRLAFLSGDWIPLAMPGWITQHFTNTQVVSLGGATEATVWSNYFLIPRQLDEQWVSIPYGYPIQNAKYHILDSNLQPVPSGVAEELYIGGQCLADGYFKRPELNQEKFIQDPFSNDPNARLYKTGDLARYMPDGNIEFLGRKDHQVKIRGYRIELGEIEAVLTEHPNIQEILTIAQPDASGNKRLIAYIVLKSAQGTTSADLRGFLKDKLPEYMVPSLFVFLDAMPLNPSGKIDRKALPAPSEQEDTQGEYVAPRSPAEYLVEELWKKILQRSRVSIYDNFFEIGGHSLLGVQFISQLSQKTGRTVPLSLLFSNPTIASFARFLEEKSNESVWNPLVAIQPTGSKTPLYCIHPVTGGVEYVNKLAAHLDADQPVFGIQAIGMNGTDVPLECAYEMADHYLKLILEQQPEGSYQLAGYSIGGLIAYEIAVRLRKMGKEVPTLILFDTYPARKQRISKYKHVGLKYIFKSWKNQLFSPHIPFKQKWSVVKDVRQMHLDFLNMVAVHFNLQARTPKQELDENIGDEYLIREEVLRASWQAGRNYQHEEYDGNVVFIRAKNNVARYLSNSDFGWKKHVTSNLSIYEIDGNHFSLFKNENTLIQIGTIVQSELDKSVLTHAPQGILV
ncbi:amino acid adenylation domain-containing protein [Cytophagaceae bacterium DM2B3-1]|uniref:Amino acid adenylation domain-containing protein n=1 Tax=Xanthocytophaga flava TaxID=3048013 RepID=A0ABT7CVZ7_9BACT|nr:amino acid adenylation domain-containing protein [Xanthocytophaga flavus]MDJ1497903.1 amino acid adenylation domain-containing protein [Xanthocytophaga flavus]